MRIELHDSMKRPLVASCTRVVLYDDHGNPLFLAVQLGKDHLRMAACADCNDDHFEEYLQELGIHRTVVVKRLGRGDIHPPRSS